MAKKSSEKPKAKNKKSVKPSKKPILTWVARPQFGVVYLALAVLVLLVTTIFWSLLGARLHQTNADQLVDPYLFSNWSVFHGATFPGAHTFLIKWPLFALVGAIGVTNATIGIATAALALITVGAFAWLLFRIERRPLVLGTVLLALAAVLLLIPAQPYAGGILPVNMAMLATRNIEYIVYLLNLVLLIKSTRFKSRHFIAGVALLSLLIASDKLFLSLSVGGAFLALVAYALVQNWRLVNLSVRWLVGGVFAGVIATLLLAAINLSGITHIAGESGANPYSFVQDGKSGVLALTYAVLGIFTNFGANPAFDATVLREVPLQALRRIFSIGGFSYLVNAAILIGGLVTSLWLVLLSTHTKKNKYVAADNTYALALLLVWSALAAASVFIVTNHYYAVDARYLTMSLFAVFVAVAVLGRKQNIRPERLVGAGLVLLVMILLSTSSALQTQRGSTSALQPIVDRNALVSQILLRHHVDVLVADYWRALPIVLESHGKVRSAPLADCTTLRQGLSSSAWQPDLHRHSFAYLISLDKSLTDFPVCSLEQVTATYGSPNTTVLIAGGVSNPKELLLFYDRGQQPPGRGGVPEVFSTVTPVQTGDMRNTSCAGPTTLSIVAHQDDDLLFMNPDVQHAIDEGHCVRTVYLTAGDGGHDKFYWLSREQGSEAAYDTMIGTKKGWLQQTVQLPGKQFMTVASPVANQKVSLLFLHLPDGNLTGHGFSGSRFESLQYSLQNPTARIHTVDHQSSYTSGELLDALRAIMQVYQPAQIHTQATAMSATYPDHSDHMAASQFAQNAYEAYLQSQYDNEIAIPFARYIGYPVRDFPANVSDEDLVKKQAAFFAYARFDGAVCYSMRDCSNTPTYGAYLERQYTEQ